MTPQLVGGNWILVRMLATEFLAPTFKHSATIRPRE